MKKINSIGYGHIIVMLIVIFAGLLPLILLLFNSIFHYKIIKLVIYISLAIGGIIFILLCTILAVELRQDSKIDKFHSKNRRVKNVLKSGRCECQNCGYSSVNIKDKTCKICGITFKKDIY